MPDRTFRLEIVTPERSVFSEDVASVVVPAHEGYLGVLAGHAPLLCTLKTGEVKIRPPNGHEHHLALAGGFMDVGPAKVIVLADSAEPSNEIDRERVLRARDRAQKRLAEHAKGTDRERAEAALARAANRLQILERYGQKPKR